MCRRTGLVCPLRHLLANGTPSPLSRSPSSQYRLSAAPGPDAPTWRPRPTLAPPAPLTDGAVTDATERSGAFPCNYTITSRRAARKGQGRREETEGDGMRRSCPSPGATGAGVFHEEERQGANYGLWEEDAWDAGGIRYTGGIGSFSGGIGDKYKKWRSGVQKWNK